jgi:hypothetical protein
VKRFLLWLAATVIAFAGLAVPTHLLQAAHPRSILVAVDTSYEMQASGPEVTRALEQVAGTRYARFALVTDKAPVQAWQDALDAGRALTYYGPRDLGALAERSRAPDARGADSVVVITNARDTAPLAGLPGLRVVRVP